jgi:protein tyrosine phosphatase (PTP) superfamily phosphohydrolase (DUF442 family)
VPQAPPDPRPVFPESRGYEPPLAEPSQATWRPSDSAGNGTIRQGVHLQTPDFNEPPPAKQPAVREGPAVSPSLPVGIAQFANAKEQVDSGLRPDPDGVNWLKEQGYKAVLHLRPPGEDDAADRNLFELKGLKYLSLEVSPELIAQQASAKKAIDDFKRIVDDTSNQPVFVYDKDGSLAGGLWYLYFRTVDRVPDSEALTKARRLGLKVDPAEDKHHRRLEAVQKYLSTLSK